MTSETSSILRNGKTFGKVPRLNKLTATPRKLSVMENHDSEWASSFQSRLPCWVSERIRGEIWLSGRGDNGVKSLLERLVQPTEQKDTQSVSEIKDERSTHSSFDKKLYKIGGLLVFFITYQANYAANFGKFSNSCLGDAFSFLLDFLSVAIILVSGKVQTLMLNSWKFLIQTK